MNLHGLRVLNTRPHGQNQALHHAIHAAQGYSIDFPLFIIEPTPTDWLQSLPSLDHVHHAIFISRNAVHYFYTEVKSKWPNTVQTIAIGHATAQALKQHAIPVHHIPLHADSEHVIALPSLQQVNKKTILLIKGENGSQAIESTLKKRGAHIQPIAVYRRILPPYSRASIRALWQKKNVDIILFTSEEAIKNLFALLPLEARPWLCNTPCLVISTRLAIAAKQRGIKTILTSRYNTILDTLFSFNQGRLYDDSIE